MNCRYVQENLIELLDGSVGDLAVSAHVKQCSSCAQKLAELRSTMGMLDEWHAPEPSPYFVSRVRARARDEREPARAGLLGWLRRPALAVTLVGLLAAGGVLVRVANLGGSPSRGPEPVAAAPGTALFDVEALDKNHDLLVNTDLLDEMSGGPSDDASDSSDLQ